MFRPVIVAIQFYQNCSEVYDRLPQSLTAPLTISSLTPSHPGPPQSTHPTLLFYNSSPQSFSPHLIKSAGEEAPAKKDRRKTRQRKDACKKTLAQKAPAKKGLAKRDQRKSAGEQNLAKAPAKKDQANKASPHCRERREAQPPGIEDS